MAEGPRFLISRRRARERRWSDHLWIVCAVHNEA
jgi:hypothetical protein